VEGTIRAIRKYEGRTNAERVGIEGEDGEKKGVSPRVPSLPSSFGDGADEAVDLVKTEGDAVLWELPYSCPRPRCDPSS